MALPLTSEATSATVSRSMEASEEPAMVQLKTTSHSATPCFNTYARLPSASFGTASPKKASSVRQNLFCGLP